jgi:Immunity protein 26
MEPKRPYHGKLFAIPLPKGDYCFAKVTLDLDKFSKFEGNKNKFSSFTDGCLLTKIFKESSPDLNFTPSEALLPGIIIFPWVFDDDWIYVRDLPFDPKEVEFPENVGRMDHSKGQGVFAKGDIHIEIPINSSTIDKIRCQTTIRQPISVANYYLYIMDRHEEIDPDLIGGCDCRKTDLRYSKYRKKIYKKTPFKQDQTYYEQQKQFGCDLEGFYKFSTGK